VSLLVIAVLAVIWVVCLTPMMLRKLSERRFTNSVDSFHRQLRGLRRAYPRLAATAADPEAALFREPSVEYAREGELDREVSYPPTRHAHPGYASMRAQRVDIQAVRRRRVLLVLASATVGFFLLGTVPALRILWGLSLLAFAAGAGYVALLIYMHRRAVERRVKVVDIRQLRRQAGIADTGPAASSRRHWDEDEWDEDDLARSYDYDELMSGGT
jgi:hypothetical protein